MHTPNECLGGESCETGYTGILCEECEYNKGYARGSTPFTCSICDSHLKIRIVALIGILFTVVMVLIVLYGNIDFRKE